jgi:large subunit ribosomal protein L10
MRKEKKLFLDEIKDNLEGAIALIVTRHNRLNPKDTWELSNALIESKSNFRVVKKRIFSMAAKECGYSYPLKDLEGHIGVVFIKGDPLSAAKAILDFKKDKQNVLEIISGQIEGKSCSPSEIELLANLPDKDTMRAEFITLLVTPLSQVLSIMEEALKGVLYCLESKK